MSERHEASEASGASGAPSPEEADAELDLDDDDEPADEKEDEAAAAAAAALALLTQRLAELEEQIDTACADDDFDLADELESQRKEVAMKIEAFGKEKSGLG